MGDHAWQELHRVAQRDGVETLWRACISSPLVGEKTYGAALSRSRSTMRQMWLASTARQAVSESRTIAWMRRLHSEIDNRGVGVGCETSTPQGDTRETQVEVRWHMRCKHHREREAEPSPTAQWHAPRRPLPDPPPPPEHTQTQHVNVITSTCPMTRERRTAPAIAAGPQPTLSAARCLRG